MSSIIKEIPVNQQSSSFYVSKYTPTFIKTNKGFPTSIIGQCTNNMWQYVAILLVSGYILFNRYK